MSKKMEILVVDDEESVREEMVIYLAGVTEGGEPVFNLTAVEDFEAAESKLEGRTFDGVILDLLLPERNMPGTDAGARLLEVMRTNPATADAAIVVLTGFATVDRAVELTKRGAWEVLQKPVDPDDLEQILRRAVERKALQRRVNELIVTAIKASTADVILHNINNDLNKIVGKAEDAIDALPDEEDKAPWTSEIYGRIKEIIDMAKGASNRAKSAIGLEKIGRGKIDICQTLKHCVEHLHRDYQMKRIRYELPADENIPSIEDYPDAIVQVFYALIENAFEAAPLDGNVKISANYNDEEKRLEVRISDDGLGMDPEQIRLAKAGGYSTKGSGRGFGLSVSNRLVQNLGGILQIESEKGKGTTVIIDIPWHEELTL